MAQHDFAPAWLNFPTPPPSSKSSLNFAKHSSTFSWTENRYEVNRRRHNSSDGLDPSCGHSNGGHSGRKERNGWRSQGRNGTENSNYRAGYHNGGSRARTRSFQSGKSQGSQENKASECETLKKTRKEEPKQFEAEDFPSLNPEHEREPNQNKSLAEGVWEYPLNPKSRSPRMLIIKKGNTKDLQISGFPVGGNIHSSQLVGNGTGLNVYKGLVPKPVIPPAKITQWKSQTKENKTGPSFPHDSAYGSGNFSALKTTAKPVGSQKSVKECNRSNSLSPVDKLGQPRLTKLTRTRSDKKSEFLKMLKRDPVEEHDENCVDQEKVQQVDDDDDDDEFNLHNSNSGHQGRDVNRNFENDSPQQMIQSSAFPQTDVLSSSLEAEHRLLKEMGWQEDSENDDTCAPLTEDEMREFQIISEQLQKNGLRKNCILKNGLICDFKFNPWKNSTFRAMLENEDTETSSSDTSDDDA
ncbi:vasculin isoform X1 [Pseudonaja textilis]|uniref:vasculin isoform X1 n=1 Tax=Pseudonaja textilis TaxID=8673 RepID=UPI000EA8A795|nr:vasculin isoform X1 [Pseudonaja textilis]